MLVIVDHKNKKIYCDCDNPLIIRTALQKTSINPAQYETLHFTSDISLFEIMPTGKTEITALNFELKETRS